MASVPEGNGQSPPPALPGSPAGPRPSRLPDALISDRTPDDPGASRLLTTARKPNDSAFYDGADYLSLLGGWDAENRTKRRQAEAAAPGTSAAGEDQTSPPPGLLPPGVLTEPAPTDGLPHAQATSTGGRAGSGAAGGKEPYLVNLGQAAELAFLNAREMQDRWEDLYQAAWPVAQDRDAFPARNDALPMNPPDGSPGDRPLSKVARQMVLNATGVQKRVVNQPVLDLNAIQPLLWGGDQGLNLETLTPGERALLYHLRDYVRFTRELFVAVAVGDSSAAATSAGEQDTTAVGYYPTLQLLSEIRNEQQNEQDFARALEYFRALEGRKVSRLQVEEVEQGCLAVRGAILQRQESYAHALEQFKIQLGVPADLPLVLDDDVLGPLTAQVRRQGTLEADYTAALTEVQRLPRLKAGPEEARAALRRLLETGGLFQRSAFQKELLQRSDAWQHLADGLDARLAELRRERQDLLTRRDGYQLANTPVPAELTTYLRLVDLDIALGVVEAALRRYEEQPATVALLRRAADDFAPLLDQVRAERIERLRDQWPQLPAVRLKGANLLELAEKDEGAAQALAAQVALEGRLDLMNQRAQLVDAWRRLAAQANILLGGADAGGRAQRPATGDYQTNLILYQRQRRALTLTEDQIVEQVRQELRQLQRLGKDYAIRQRNLELAYSVVSKALEAFQEPAPTEQGEAATAPAALTQQLLNALGGLPQAQDDLMATWIDYVAARMQFFRDLELLRVDSRRVWIEEAATPENPAGALASPVDRAAEFHGPAAR